jgi:uncharacterized protein with von Willebrand factor type A (vWA) domain
MKKHVFVLMDESGSMDGLEESVTTGCNEMIHKFRNDKDARIWLAWFDKSPGARRTRLKIRGEKAGEVSQLKPSDYRPRGLTPLNDAIADAVAMLDAAAGEEDVVFLSIITDGFENASEHSTASIKQLLMQREEQGWGIVLIGANQNTVETAAEFGMDRPGRAFNFDADEQSVRASMRNVSKVAEYRTKREAGKKGLEEYDKEVAELFMKDGGKLDRD